MAADTHLGGMVCARMCVCACMCTCVLCMYCQVFVQLCSFACLCGMYICACRNVCERMRVCVSIASQSVYGRWMDCFRLGYRLLLVLEKRKGKELIITMTESMSRGAALTFSSLCLAKGQWGVVCLHPCGSEPFVCVCKTQR